ncbi:MAG: hypothetical protein LBL90_07205, partial [Prevotellaceae bacterium]|nr:hypothetical protein [Prevotellaceae bacterium]
STQKSNRSGQNSGEFLIFLFFFSGYQSFMPKHRVLQVSRYVVWKEKKEFSADLKNIYNAPARETAKMELELFEQKRDAKYPYAILS